MGYQERTHQVLLNMARIDPTGFSTKYFSVDDAYACNVTANLRPLRYATTLQQAALQQSSIISDPACPFQHDTCSAYCYLYGSCAWDARIKKYEPSTGWLGENIASTTSVSPLRPLIIWLKSSGHCTNIFKGDYDHIGIGKYTSKWTQVFASLTSTYTTPLLVGSHFVDTAIVGRRLAQEEKRESSQDQVLRHMATGQKIRFLANYFSTDEAPTSFQVTLGTTSYNMTLHLGGATNGAYSVDVVNTIDSGCQFYFFTVTNSKGTFKLPGM